MTKALIQKNIKLSLDFDTYVSRNPGVLNSVPKGSNIVITSWKDRKLSEANLKIVRSSRSGKFVVAHKAKNRWTIKKAK